ncbi:MAG TPA: peptide ligase PGM1-related protein [Acidimicrobiales bacterium]|nr:peptide ligase PGM1-related protein [Acidimicrobiales bacterium]
MVTFEQLQGRLPTALAANTPGSEVEHVCVALPSYSVGESLLSHYVDRIPSLEHRFLLAAFMLHRIEACELVFLSSEAPGDDIVDYYASLVPPERQAGVRKRLRIVEVPDRSARSVAAKLLDRPQLLDSLRESFGGRPAFIEPWNVTDYEVEVALRLDAPIHGTPPELRCLGYKSEGRRLFRRAGVPVPYGCEDVRTVDDVVAAVASVRAARPQATGVVVKHDDSGAGDGNVVLDLRPHDPDEHVRAQVERLPDWYLRDLRAGGVVEERIAGTRFTSPSVQVDLAPGREPVVLATHEQVLGGDNDQVYLGCRFPADPAYAPQLARHARAIAEELAGRGVIGRIAIDFAAVADASGRHEVFALEVNLRKGGTTHPYSVLRHLAPGRYDAEAGQWVAFDGLPRAYRATDNLLDEAWTGLPPRAVIDAVASAGLQLDHRTGTGVVLHMLSGLALDGRFGITAVGRSDDHAAELYEATRAAVDRLV